MTLERLGNLDGQTIMLANALNASRDKSVRLLDVLHLTGQAIRGTLEGAAWPNKEFTLPFDGVSLTLHGTGPNSSAHVGRWIRGFYISAICRDEDMMRSICAIPTSVLRGSSTTSDEYNFLLVDALRAYRDRAPNFGDTLVAALEATEPSALKISTFDEVLSHAVPEMEMLLYLAREEQPDFDDAVIKALTLHREYWGTVERKNNMNGAFLALAPMAMLALAFDRGMTLGVSSDYCPPWLVRRLPAATRVE